MSGGERAGGVGGDLELALGERRGGAGERGVGGVGGLDRRGDLGADRPGLRVRLVEEDAGGFGGAGMGRA